MIPIKSPIEYLKKEHADRVLMVRMMADLMALHKEFMNKYQEIVKITKTPGPKGDAVKGDKGDKPTHDELLSIIVPLIPKVEHGKTPTYDELLSIIKPLIPQVKEKDVVITDDHINKISEIVSKKIKLPKSKDTLADVMDPLSIIDKISNLPKGKGLNTKHIDGLDQTISAMQTQLRRGYLHGAGDTVKAGSNIVISIDANGNKVISSTGGGISAPVDPTSGDIDGVNTVFTFAMKPTLIVNDDATYRENKGWTWDSGTLTVTLSVPPTYDLYAL